MDVANSCGDSNYALDLTGSVRVLLVAVLKVGVQACSSSAKSRRNSGWDAASLITRYHTHTFTRTHAEAPGLAAAINLNLLAHGLSPSIFFLLAVDGRVGLCKGNPRLPVPVYLLSVEAQPPLPHPHLPIHPPPSWSQAGETSLPRHFYHSHPSPPTT